MCNITCTGEPSDICGGKDHASVYGSMYEYLWAKDNVDVTLRSIDVSSNYNATDKLIIEISYLIEHNCAIPLNNVLHLIETVVSKFWIFLNQQCS